MPYGNRHEVNFFSTTEILTNSIKTEDIWNPKSNTYSRNVSDNNNKDTIERIEYTNHSRSKYYIFTIY